METISPEEDERKATPQGHAAWNGESERIRSAHARKHWCETASGNDPRGFVAMEGEQSALVARNKVIGLAASHKASR